jgi:hypothetical protein
MDAHVVIYCDNISSSILVNNSVDHVRTKHIKVHYHFVKKKVIVGKINLIHVNIEDKVIDIFIKALGIDKLRKFRKMFIVLKMHLNLRGSVENSNSTN